MSCCVCGVHDGWVRGTHANCIMSFLPLIFNCEVVWNDIIENANTKKKQYLFTDVMGFPERSIKSLLYFFTLVYH